MSAYDFSSAVRHLEQITGPSGQGAVALGVVLAEVARTRAAAHDLLELLDDTGVFRDEKIGHAADRLDQIVHPPVQS